MADTLLDSYLEKLFKLVKETPNDMDLGAEVRKLLEKMPEHLKQKYS